jgi:hypothetical protein
MKLHVKMWTTIMTALLLFASCELSSETKQEVTRAVWSDDGLRQAYVVHSYEQAGSKTTNSSWQVWVQDADGSNREAVGEPFYAEIGPQFYFMKTANFFVVELLESATQRRYVRMYRDTGDCGDFKSWTDPQQDFACIEVSPGPNGDYIGVMERLAGEDKTWARLFFSDTLLPRCSFLYAVTGRTRSRWTADSKFIIQDDADDAREVDANNGMIPVAPLSNFYPKTTSSDINAAGVQIGPGPSVDNPVVVIAVGQTPFGG